MLWEAAARVLHVFGVYGLDLDAGEQQQDPGEERQGAEGGDVREPAGDWDGLSPKWVTATLRAWAQPTGCPEAAQ
jgi:hypothetical protein